MGQWRHMWGGVLGGIGLIAVDGSIHLFELSAAQASEEGATLMACAEAHGL